MFSEWFVIDGDGVVRVLFMLLKESFFSSDCRRFIYLGGFYM